MTDVAEVVRHHRALLNNGAVSSPSAAANIDNKIEQAMDLVKTHLMFAVREEMERMRTQLIQLERKLVILEAENAILRQNMPKDVVAKLLATSSNNAATQAADK